MSTGYLNTDLDIASSTPIDQLVTELEQLTTLLHYEQFDDGMWQARIETESWHQQPQDSLDNLLDVINRLSPAAGKQWDNLIAKDFNIGWQAGTQRPEGRYTVSAATLKGIAKLGGTLSATIYPAEP